MRQNVVVIDTGSGNFTSVLSALARFTTSVTLSSRPESVIGSPSHFVVPGVGSFDACIEQLGRSGWADQLRGAIESSSTPVLGICVGLQAMARSSEESRRGVSGLAVFPGIVRALRSLDQVHVQNVGWDDVEFTESTLGFSAGDTVDFYFDHGYALPPDGPNVVATSGRSQRFCAVMSSGVAYGVQFHPERSGEAGMALLGSFLRITNG